MSVFKARSSWQVTRAVWHAMFMREFVARTMADRMAWFWMLVEPIAMIAILLVIKTVILGRSRMVVNAELVPWMIVGLLGFFLFRENMMRSLAAINMNKALYTFRQVKPVDSVLVRCFLEGMLKSFIFLLFILAAGLLGIEVYPDLPLQAIGAWLSLWCLGIGLGLTLSVLSTLVAEVGIIVRLMSLPLMILSGAIIPVTILPHYLHEYLLLNPILHGIETLRLAFFESYYTLPGIDMYYLWWWSLGTLLIGFALHLRFEVRLKAQ